MKSSTVTETVSGLLILLFVYTAASKLTDIEQFSGSLLNAPLLSHFAKWFAILIPAIEIIIAVLLFFQRFRLKGLYASVLLLSIFTFYLLWAVVFNPGDLPCTCGGVLKYLTWKQHILFNIFFVVLAFAGILLKRGRNERPDVYQKTSTY